jgi:hypothetical protein
MVLPWREVTGSPSSVIQNLAILFGFVVVRLLGDYRAGDAVRSAAYCVVDMGPVAVEYRSHKLRRGGEPELWEVLRDEAD